MRGLDGRSRRRSVYGRTRLEVQKKLRELAVTGRIAWDGERLRLRDYLEEWVEGRRGNVRPSTYRSYHGIVHKHLIPALGGLSVAAVGRRHIQAYVAGGFGCRPITTIRAVRSCGPAKGARGCDAEELVPSNVAKRVTPPRPLHYQARAFSEGELNILGTALDGHWLGPVVTIAVGLGLRQGEVLGLRWDDVDLDRGVVSITGALQRVHGGLHRVEPKTRQSRRALRLSNELVSVLQARRSSQAEERQLAGPDWQESGYVFTTRLGTPRDGRNVTEALPGHRRGCESGPPPVSRFAAHYGLDARGRGDPSAGRHGDAGSQSDCADDEHLRARAAGATDGSGDDHGPRPRPEPAAAGGLGTPSIRPSKSEGRWPRYER